MPAPYRADQVGSFLRPRDLLDARAEGGDPFVTRDTGNAVVRRAKTASVR